MNRLSIAAAVATIVAFPALAQSSRNIQTQRPAQTQERANSYEVRSGQRRLGTDPDPNVQFDLLRQQNWR